MNEQVRTKKLINLAENIIAEMIEGMVGARDWSSCVTRQDNDQRRVSK